MLHLLNVFLLLLLGCLQCMAAPGTRVGATGGQRFLGGARRQGSRQGLHDCVHAWQFSRLTTSHVTQIVLRIRIRLKTASYKARFPFKRNRLRCVRCVRCVNENRKKRKRLRWQAANHGCHCFDRVFLLAGDCV